MNAVLKYDILGTRNDYELPISRNKADEIRSDPFGLGNNVKGLTSVNHQRNLSNYAEELVANFANYKHEQYFLLLSDLPEYEQNELARLYLESTDRDTSECVHGNDFSIENEYTCALLSMLKDDSQENREKFAEVTRKNIINYYEKFLQELLDESCNDYLNNMMNEQGRYARYDMEHGDVLWTR